MTDCKPPSRFSSETGIQSLSMSQEARKNAGAYYTPDGAVASLVSWAVRTPRDQMLDPSCGDGRFLALHHYSGGVERDTATVKLARERVPWAMIHEGDFFEWAAETRERFDCAAGNPPFIRYQRFSGGVRTAALSLCARLGAKFTALTSSWAPFLVGAASLLRRGGRMAFVVPAEIGHAPYASPLLTYLAEHFDLVQIVAVRNKLFPDLSESCWLLYANGYGGKSSGFKLSLVERFQFSPSPPSDGVFVSLGEWHLWNRRIRPFLLAGSVRSFYQAVTAESQTLSLGQVSRVGIGYVTGANDFFHLRPSEAQQIGIPERFLCAAVRSSKQLSAASVTPNTVRSWLRNDDPVLLMRLTAQHFLIEG